MTSKPQYNREFFRLSIPNVLSNLTVPLAGLIDTALLGHLQDIKYLAGVALGSILFDYLYWMFGFFRMSTTGLTAQAMGAGDQTELRIIPARGLVISIGCGLILLLMHHSLSDLGFLILDGTEAVKEQGRLYFEGRIWGAPVVLANFVLTGWLLGIGRGKSILFLSLIANGSNIALDYLFIFRLGLGSWGAGSATMISQYLMFGVGCWFFIRETKDTTFRIKWIHLFEKKAIVKLVALNRDIFIRTFLLISCFSYFTNASSGLGTLYLAGNSILLKILSIASYFIDGLAFAVESLAGRFKGANDDSSLHSVIRLALIAGAFTGFFFAIMFNLFPNQLFFILTSQEDVLLLLKGTSLWLFPVMILGSAAYIWDGVFLGLSEGKILRNCMIFSTMLGFLPFAVYAARIGSNNLLWLSLSFFMMVRAGSLWWSMIHRRNLASA